MNYTIYGSIPAQTTPAPESTTTYVTPAPPTTYVAPAPTATYVAPGPVPTTTVIRTP